MTDKIRRNHLRPEEYDDHEHRPYLLETGYFGKQGAGAIVMARSTGRVLIGLRSFEVEEPHTWGTFGGAIPSETGITELVHREIQEETGAENVEELVPLLLFVDEGVGFRFHNFLAIVPDEFVPRLNWEHDRAEWFDVGDWPEPMHFGLKALLDDAASEATIRDWSDDIALRSPGMKT